MSLGLKIDPRHEKSVLFLFKQKLKAQISCATAQTDQCLIEFRHVYSLSDNFPPLTGCCGCAGWFVSDLVEIPEDRLSGEGAQSILLLS